MSEEVEILLVEDNMYDAELTILALRESKVIKNIIHLKDGAEAIDFIFGYGRFEARNINNQPKIILLDLKMPKVDGMEVLQKIKTNILTKRIPVVVLTSSKETPDIERCYALGVNSYIVKPVEADNFRKCLYDLGLYWQIINQSPY